MDGPAVSEGSVAVIVNPKAGRGNGKGMALANLLRDKNVPNVTVIDRFEQVAETVRKACSTNASTLCISSGDGTIQFIQTYLAETIKPARMPALCLFPHGTTNMTAADIGFRSKSLEKQAAFVMSGTAAQQVSRPSLRISNTRDGAIRHGMFLGTGAITAATKYCQSALNDRGVHGNFATGAVLALALGKSVFGKSSRDNATRFDQPFEIALTVDGDALTQGPQLLALCTTLEKLILNSRPFWGGAAGPIRATAIAYPPPPILRWTWPILFGAEARKLPPAARSKAGSAILIESPVPYVLDGEFFDGPEHGAIAVEPGPSLTYIRA
jgi:diacylglycerol kinase (ATP)